MTARHCPHEDAVVAVALDATQDLSVELVAHLAACAGCRDVLMIASALHGDPGAALAEGRVPSAGQAWWRAELRARQEAAAIASRPITVAAGLAAASVLGLLASLTGVLSWWLQDWPTLPASMQAAGAVLAASALGDVTAVRAAVLTCVGVMLLATPVLLYVALTDE